MGKMRDTLHNFGDEVAQETDRTMSGPGNVAESVGKGLKTAVLTVGKGLEVLVSGGIGKHGDYPETSAGKKVTRAADRIGGGIERAATNVAQGLDKTFCTGKKEPRRAESDDSPINN